MTYSGTCSSLATIYCYTIDIVVFDNCLDHLIYSLRYWRRL